MNQLDRTGRIFRYFLFAASLVSLGTILFLPHPEQIFRISQPADAYLPDSFRMFVKQRPFHRMSLIAFLLVLLGFHAALILVKKYSTKSGLRNAFLEMVPPFASFLPIVALSWISAFPGRILLVLVVGLYAMAVADSFREGIKAMLDRVFSRRIEIILLSGSAWIFVQILAMIAINAEYGSFALANQLAGSRKFVLRKAGLLFILLPILYYFLGDFGVFRPTSRYHRVWMRMVAYLDSWRLRFAWIGTQGERLRKPVRDYVEWTHLGSGSVVAAIHLAVLGALVAATAGIVQRDVFVFFRHDFLAPLLLAVALLLVAAPVGRFTDLFSFSENREGQRTRAVYWSALLLVTAAYFVYFTNLALQRLHAFLPAMYDLSFQHQALWNMAQSGVPWLSLGSKGGLHDRVFWPDHVPLLYYAFVPVYRLFPSVETLIVLQNFFVAIAALPVFLLGRKMAGSSLWGFLFSLVFLFHPSIQSMNVWDVQATSFAPFFFLMALYLYESGKKVPFLACMILGGLAREDMNLFTVSTGLMLIVMNRDYRWGLISLFSGLIQFLIMSVVFQGYFGGISHYERFLPLFFVEGEYSISGIVSLLLFNPVYFFKTAFLWNKLIFLVQLLLPLALLPLLGGEAWLIALAGLASTILSMQDANFTLGYQYSTLLILAFIYISLYVVKKSARVALRDKGPSQKEGRERSKTISAWNIIGIYLFLSALLFGNVYGYLYPRTYKLGFIGGWNEPFTDRLYPDRYLYRGLIVVTRNPPVVTEDMKDLREALRTIPPDLKTAAPVPISVFLTGRRYSYVLPRVDDADVVVVNPMFENYEIGLKLLSDGGFTLHEKKGETLLLYRKRAVSPSNLN